LDLERWEGLSEQEPYHPRFKARVVAWYRLENLISAHMSDAAQDKAKREAQRK
jgi:hypothetical protein